MLSFSNKQKGKKIKEKRKKRRRETVSPSTLLNVPSKPNSAYTVTVLRVKDVESGI